jgi:histone-lysine N-methyltransferase SETMAR
VTAEVYCVQIENLMANLKAKQPEHDKIYFLHVNTRPHVEKLVYKKLLENGWELLPHPPYSTGLAPFIVTLQDYHLFQSLSKSLQEKTI